MKQAMGPKEDHLYEHISFLYDFIKKHKTTSEGYPVWELSFRREEKEARDDADEDFSEPYDIGVSSWRKRHRFTKGHLNVRNLTTHLRKVKVKSDREPLVTRTPDSLRTSMDWDIIDMADGKKRSLFSPQDSRCREI